MRPQAAQHAPSTSVSERPAHGSAGQPPTGQLVSIERFVRAWSRACTGSPLEVRLSFLTAPAS